MPSEPVVFERIVVPCVLQRVELRPALAQQLAREFEGVPVVWMEQPPHLPPSANIPRVFASASGHPDRYMLHIEDDARLAVGSGARMQRDAMLLHGEQAVSFFSIRRRDGERHERGISFAVCVAVRADVAWAFGAWYQRWLAAHPEHFHAVDIALNEFTQGSCWTRYPSLAQHLPVKSALGPRSSRRQSPTYSEVAA